MIFNSFFRINNLSNKGAELLFKGIVELDRLQSLDLNIM